MIASTNAGGPDTCDSTHKSPAKIAIASRALITLGLGTIRHKWGASFLPTLLHPDISDILRAQVAVNRKRF
jgi:hypothetical protein